MSRVRGGVTAAHGDTAREGLSVAAAQALADKEVWQPRHFGSMSSGAQRVIHSRYRTEVHSVLGSFKTGAVSADGTCGEAQQSLSSRTTSERPSLQTLAMLTPVKAAAGPAATPAGMPSTIRAAHRSCVTSPASPTAHECTAYSTSTLPTVAALNDSARLEFEYGCARALDFVEPEEEDAASAPAAATAARTRSVTDETQDDLGHNSTSTARALLANEMSLLSSPTTSARARRELHFDTHVPPSSSLLLDALLGVHHHPARDSVQLGQAKSGTLDFAFDDASNSDADAWSVDVSTAHADGSRASNAKRGSSGCTEYRVISIFGKQSVQRVHVHRRAAEPVTSISTTTDTASSVCNVSRTTERASPSHTRWEHIRRRTRRGDTDPVDRHAMFAAAQRRGAPASTRLRARSEATR